MATCVNQKGNRDRKRSQLEHKDLMVFYKKKYIVFLSVYLCLVYPQKTETKLKETKRKKKAENKIIPTISIIQKFSQSASIIRKLFAFVLFVKQILGTVIVQSVIESSQPDPLSLVLPVYHNSR